MPLALSFLFRAGTAAPSPFTSIQAERIGSPSSSVPTATTFKVKPLFHPVSWLRDFVKDNRRWLTLPVVSLSAKAERITSAEAEKADEPRTPESLDLP